MFAAVSAFAGTNIVRAGIGVWTGTPVLDVTGRWKEIFAAAGSALVVYLTGLGAVGRR